MINGRTSKKHESTPWKGGGVPESFPFIIRGTNYIIISSEGCLTSTCKGDENVGLLLFFDWGFWELPWNIILMFEMVDGLDNFVSVTYEKL